MWDIDNPSHAKIRHIHLHLSITVGKLAKLIEPLDHEDFKGDSVNYSAATCDLSPILADLLMHCAQIANLAHGELGEMLAARYVQNANRFAPESALATLNSPGRA